MEPFQARRVNLRGIIYKDGKIFCQRLKSGSDSKERDYWCTPGGGIDFGESLHVGLTREMIEETGVKPEIGNLLFISQFHDGKKEQLEFFFHIKNADDYETIDLASTSHGDLEIETCEFIDPKTHNVLPKFLTEIDIESVIDCGSPAAIYSEL